VLAGDDGRDGVRLLVPALSAVHSDKAIKEEMEELSGNHSPRRGVKEKYAAECKEDAFL